MAIFSGFGPALGAAAQGFLGGQVKSEQMLYDRQRKETDLALRKLALQSRKKELDPNAKIRENAGRAANQLTTMLYDRTMQEYYQSPQGRGFAKKLSEQIQKHRDIEFGRVQPDEASTHELSAGWVADEETGGGGGPASGFGAMGEAGKAQQALPFLREPGTSMASFEGTPMPASAQPPAPPKFGPPAPPLAPPKPPTALERYYQISHNRPIVQPRPGMTPKQIADEQAASDRVWESQRDDAYKAVKLEDEAGILKNRRITTGVDAGNAAERGRLRNIKDTESIKNLRQQTGTLADARPIKKQKGLVDIEKGKVGIEKTKEETKTIAPRLKLEERRTATGEKQARISKEQLMLAQRREKRLAADVKAALAIKANTDEERRLQQEINNEFKVKTAQRDPKKFDRYSDPRQEMAQRRIEKNLARLKEIREGGTKAGGGGQKKFMGKAYTWENFLAEGRRKNKDEGFLKRTWAGLPGG